MECPLGHGRNSPFPTIGRLSDKLAMPTSRNTVIRSDITGCRRCRCRTRRQRCDQEVPACGNSASEWSMWALLQMARGSLEGTCYTIDLEGTLMTGLIHTKSLKGYVARLKQHLVSSQRLAQEEAARDVLLDMNATLAIAAIPRRMSIDHSLP